jgi:hypothetical protein
VLAAAPAAAERSAYRPHRVPGYGISLLLPSSWKALDWRDVLTDAELKALARDNPDLVGSIAAMQQPNSPVKFFAFDPTPARGFATNANVVVLPVSAKVTFERYASLLTSEVSSLKGVSRLRVARARLPAGASVRLSYRLRFRSAGRTLTVSTLQYAFQRPSRSVVVTFTTLPGLEALYTPVFSTSARSIRFD